MTVINDLSENMPIARICRAMDISRSSVYYRSRERNPNRRSRISPEIEERILNTAENRTTTATGEYGQSSEIQEHPST